MSVKIMVFSALIIFMGTLFISSDILAFGGADIVSMEKLAQKAVVSIDAQSPWQNWKTERAKYSIKQQLWDMDETTQEPGEVLVDFC